MLDIPLQLYRGLVTKFAPKETAGTALIQSDNADGFDVFRGYGKLPGTEAVAPTVSGSTYHSLHNYEYVTLSGTQARQRLGVLDTVLYKITTDAVTQVAGGLVAEPIFGIVSGDTFYYSSANNPPGKYDGTNKYDWGLVAPGLQETVIVPFNDAVGWDVTYSGDGVSASTAVSIDGQGSAVFTKNQTSTNVYEVATVSGAFNFAQAGDPVNFWIHIPKEDYSKITATGNAVSLVLGSGLPPFAYSKTYHTAPGELSEGWNLITHSLSTPDSSSGSLSLAGVKDIKFQIYTKAAGNTFSSILLDKLYVTDDGYPGGTAGASGNVSGTVTYAVTFVDKDGFESNLGPGGGSVAVVGKQVTVTGIPVSAQTNVVARDIYRDLNGDALYRYVGTINDNTTTTFTDNVGTPSSDTPPEAGSLDGDDNSPPQRMTTVALWNNHIFGIDALDPKNLFIIPVVEPNSLPTAQDNILTFERGLVALLGHADALYIYAEDRTWTLEGDSVSDFVVTEENPDIGCSGPRALVNVKGEIVSWHDTGPYLWLSSSSLSTSRRLPAYLGNEIRDIIEALDPASFKDMFVVHNRARLRILFFIQSTAGGKYDTILAYNYGHSSIGQLDTQGYVDPHDLRKGTWSTVALPSSVNPTCAVATQDDSSLPLTIIGTDDGNVYHLQKPGVFNYAQTPASGTVAVPMTIQTQVFPLAGTPGQFGKLRYLEFSCTAVASGTLDITYETLTGEAGAVLTTTGVRMPYIAGDSTPLISFKQYGPPGAFGRLTFANSYIDEDIIINSVTAKIIPMNYRGNRSQ